MTTINDYFKPKFNLSSLFLGVTGLIFGIYSTLYGITPLNSYMLFGLLMSIHFIYEISKEDRVSLSWGLWFAFLASQVCYTVVTGKEELTFVFGLLIANFIFKFLEDKAVFKALLVVLLAVLLPIQFGGLIAGVSLFFYICSLFKEDLMTTCIVFAFALSACYNEGTIIECLVCLLPALALSQHVTINDVKVTLKEVIIGFFTPQFIILALVFIALVFK